MFSQFGGKYLNALFIYWLCYLAFGILVTQQGIEPEPPAVEMQSPNHWTAKGFLFSQVLMLQHPHPLPGHEHALECTHRTHTHTYRHTHTHRLLILLNFGLERVAAAEGDQGDQFSIGTKNLNKICLTLRFQSLESRVCLFPLLPFHFEKSPRVALFHFASPPSADTRLNPTVSQALCCLLSNFKRNEIQPLPSRS